MGAPVFHTRRAPILATDHILFPPARGFVGGVRAEL